MNTALLLNFINHHGYIAIFATIFLQEMGISLIVPSEVALMFGGYEVYLHHFNIAQIIGTSVTGDFLGSFILFFLCKRLGHIILPWLEKLLGITKEKQIKVEALVNRYGGLYIFVGRFIPYLKFYTTIFAGLLDISYKRFVLASFLASLVWVTSFVLLGVLLGRQVLWAVEYLNGFERFSIIIFLLILGFVAWNILKHAKRIRGHNRIHQ